MDFEDVMQKLTVDQFRIVSEMLLSLKKENDVLRTKLKVTLDLSSTILEEVVCVQEENTRLKEQLKWVRFADEIPEEGQEIVVARWYGVGEGWSRSMSVLVYPEGKNRIDPYRDYWRPVNVPEEDEIQEAEG